MTESLITDQNVIFFLRTKDWNNDLRNRIHLHELAFTHDKMIIFCPTFLGLYASIHGTQVLIIILLLLSKF